MANEPRLDLWRGPADAYRKEIEQQENVWRSLPFFAATLALQLTALAQIRDWISGVVRPRFAVASVLLTGAGAATLTALVFLAMSVWPATSGVLRASSPFATTRTVRAEAEANSPPGTAPREVAETAQSTIKAALVEQYALAVDQNRLINEARAKWRARAGLATLAPSLRSLWRRLC